MRVYFASPSNQLKAQAVVGKPVLFSFSEWTPFLDQFQASYTNLLIDCGAFAALTTGVPVDIQAYKQWSLRWIGHADAIAGLDDINGDYRQGLRNLEEIPWSFPTWHDTDPIELIPELVAIAKERKTWIAIGLKPPREGKERIVREFCDQIPENVHVHGWALRRYTNVRRIDSVDSTNWFRDAMKIRRDLPWLTYGETLDLVTKRYEREPRLIEDGQPNLFNTSSLLDEDLTVTV